MLRDGDSCGPAVRSVVSDEDFYLAAHAIVFAVIADRLDAGKLIAPSLSPRGYGTAASWMRSAGRRASASCGTAPRRRRTPSTTPASSGTGPADTEAAPVADILRDTLDRTDDREAGSLAAEFIPTGFPLLDTMTGQFWPSQLAVVGARPSVGKSALLLAMTRAAAEAGFPALVVSLEMSSDEHDERLLADRADVRLGRIRGPSP